jgi:hypothetical protein
MENIGDKVDNTPGASGELTADEYNDHKNELQELVESSGQVLSGLDTPEQISRASFIYGTSSQSVGDAAPSANIIELTPVTGASGLRVPDAYSQMDGMVLEFNKPVANTSATVTVNFGQTSGTLLGAKSLKKQDGNDPLIGQVQGSLRLYFDVSNDYWVILPYGSIKESTGYIRTKLDISGTNLIVRSPQIEIGNLLVKQPDVTIDITALTASTWYALCCNETTGAITAEDISGVFNTGGGGNWNISGNQLNVFASIWDNIRKYCRAYDATDYYRVFGIGFVNSGSTDFDHLFYVPNLPLSRVLATRDTDQAFSTGTTVINYATIAYDLNSEYVSTTGFDPKFAQIITHQAQMGATIASTTAEIIIRIDHNNLPKFSLRSLVSQQNIRANAVKTTPHYPGQVAVYNFETNSGLTVVGSAIQNSLYIVGHAQA